MKLLVTGGPWMNYSACMSPMQCWTWPQDDANATTSEVTKTGSAVTPITL